MSRSELGITVGDNPGSAVFAFRYRYRVDVHGYDGDSPRFTVDHGRRRFEERVDIRLYGINTPELRGEERQEGLRVRDIVRTWIPIGSEGWLESHKKDTGKYGRLLATVWPDGWEKSVNERLHDEGLGDITTYNEKTDAILRSLWDDGD